MGQFRIMVAYSPLVSPSHAIPTSSHGAPINEVIAVDPYATPATTHNTLHDMPPPSTTIRENTPVVPIHGASQELVE